MTIKAKQVAAVTLLVGLAVVGLSGIHLTSLVRVSLQESRSRGEMMAHAIYQRAHAVVPTAADPHAALRDDPGIRSILESTVAYSRNVTYAAVVDPAGKAIAHSFRSLEGKAMAPEIDLAALTEQASLQQIRAIVGDRTLEVRQALVLEQQQSQRQFGSIRIGVSTLLIRNDVREALRPAIVTALVALLIATLVASLLAQWILRPIHVIKAGLTRLERGDLDVSLDLPPGDEFSELGTSFKTISQQLTAMRQHAPASTTSVESVVEGLEDAVAIFNTQGELIFANAAMRATAADLEIGRPVDDLFPPPHPYRRVVERTLSERQTQGPLATRVADLENQEVERWVVAHIISDPERGCIGAILVVRDLTYISNVQSTISYSRKLAALGRLFAGVAHEVKNPLNAMMIHLELLRHKLKPRRRTAMAGRAGTAVLQAEEPPLPDVEGAIEHADVITAEIRRLDQVVQDFLKFTRPEELSLRPLQPATLIEEVIRVIEPEAQQTGVELKQDCSADLPDINGDPGMLRQALLNLALNAVQAMPQGGSLRMACRRTSRRRVELLVEDTGSGIDPKHLEQIFDLYFTTKEKGSGIGLSMVYRIIQLHDGEIEVQSTPGHGTTFRIVLPEA
jgi:signal transduction histidine kinase/HAMP domain-containing protein